MRAFNPYTGIAPHIDSGVYLGVAEHLLHGKVLYRGVWDHKPPMVYFIDGLALALGDHTVNSVRTVEQWVAALAALAVFAVALLAFESVPVAAFASVVFVAHFYHPNIMRGNQPEEFGSVETLVGVAFCLATFHVSWKSRRVLAAGSGLAFGLACLTKEPFVLGVVPWLFLLLWNFREDRRGALRCGIWFLAGLLAPLLLFGVYLVWNGAVSDWLDAVRFNLSYIHFDARNQPNPGLPALLFRGFERGHELVFGVSCVTAVLAVVGVAASVAGDFRRRTRGLPVALLAFFVLNLAAVSMARQYGYYYLQIVPSYVLLASCGLSFLLFLTHKRRVVRAVILGALVVAASITDRGEALRFARAINQCRATFSGDSDVVAFIRAHSEASDRIWSLIRGGSAVYAHADRLSPTRFLYMSGFFFRDLPNPENAKREIRSALAKDPPKFVLCDSDESLLTRAGLDEWFHANYTRTAIPEVFQRRASFPALEQEE